MTLAPGAHNLFERPYPTHAGLLGGIALTLGQLALLPDLVVWAASWFVSS